MEKERKATVFDLLRYFKHTDCSSCMFENICCKEEDFDDCFDVIMTHTDVVNDKILKWCDEHPMPTRQSEFLELHPNVPLDEDNTLLITPCGFDKVYSEISRNDTCCGNCDECRKAYWNKEA